MAFSLGRIFGQKQRDLPGVLRHHLALKKRFDSRAPIAEAEFVAFDTELTGLNRRKDSLLSLGAVRMKGGRIYPAKSFYRLVKPESELKRQGILVHEITPSDLDDAENLEQALEDFLRFIGDAVLVGHFVHIDVGFVSRALKSKFGVSLQNPAVDTASLHEWLYENDSRFARHFRGMTSKTDLFSVAKRYGVGLKKAHNAFYDAYVTAQLFQRFLSFLPENGIKTVRELLMVGAS